MTLCQRDRGRGKSIGMPTFLHRSLAFCSAAMLFVGCAAQPVNPSLPTTTPQAQCDLSRMKASPGQLERPLVIIGGFADPGIAAGSLKREFDAMTRGRRIIAVSLWWRWSAEACRREVIRAVDCAFPNTDPKRTSEVDVIGYSLGGFAARYAAVGSSANCRTLRIARLFAISSPLQGADDVCRWPALLPIQKDLRPGSAVLSRINASAAPYPIFAYVRLGDHPVGVANAAPPGRVAWWVATPAFEDAHNGAYKDPRILADIARRLRGETPAAHDPPAPLPAGP